MDVSLWRFGEPVSRDGDDEAATCGGGNKGRRRQVTTIAACNDVVGP